MKVSKVIFAMAAALMLAVASCSQGPTPAQQAIDLTEATVTQIEQAKDMAELNSIQQDFQKKFEAIENPQDYKPTAEEESKLQTAMQNYLQAYITKVNELAEVSTPVTSGDVDKDAATGTIQEGIVEASEE